MNPDERRQLIDAALEGDISEADFLSLEAEMTVDPIARQEYYEQLSLTVLLEVEAEAEERNETPNVVVSVSRAALALRHWKQAFVAAATAALVMLAVIGWLVVTSQPGDNIASNSQSTTVAPVEELVTGFAVVAGQSDAIWRSGEVYPNGSLLPHGLLQLDSGIVHLELFSGVTVVVEGNAEFSVLSPMEISVAAGTVRAHVPEPAHGFRVNTAEGEIVDLGTDFAVNVTNGQSEIHVLEGEIEWHPHEHEMLTMEKGRALRWSSSGESTEISADNRQFVGALELRRRLESTRDALRQNWIESSEEIRQDPRLLAFYQTGLVDRWDRQLPNLAIAHDHVAGEGAIVAAARSTDRWGQPDGALDFSPTGSRIRLSVPGQHRSLTLICWVKINSLDRWYNSLFLTDGHELNEPHWQIMDDGRLFFSVKKRDQWDSSKGEKDKHIFYSPRFWNSSLSGQWLMIATVYDVDARRVTHFLNGQPLSQEEIPDDYLVEQVKIGNASLCNWGLPERNEPRFAVRNLNGSMDEFALFSAALSPDEIAELYEKGKP